MSDPDRLQCSGKGQEKYVRWSKLLPLSFPGTQIRLEVHPGPAAVHITSSTQRFRQKGPRVQAYGCEEQLP